MSEKQLLTWSGNEIIRFLDIYRKYDGLWDTNNENYTKRNAREDSFKRIIRELIEAGFIIPDEETLRKKIENLKDAYRNEVNKVKKSMKSGAGTENVYKPKLVWFDKADSFWRNVIISGRESSSNLDLSSMTQSSTADVYDSRDEKEDGDSRETGAHEPPKKSLKVKNTKKMASSFEMAVSKLHEIAKMSNADTEDQYSHFANHIASQLRELPVMSFVVLQEKIQSLITQERLAIINTSTFQPSPCASSCSNLNSEIKTEQVDDCSGLDPVQASFLKMCD